MARKDDDRGQYQKEISNAVDSGGGCAEAWEATTEHREEHSTDRRSAVKYIASVLGLIGGPVVVGSDTAVAELEESEETEVTDITDDSKRSTAVKRATSDERTTQLIEYVENRGYEKQFDKVTVLKSEVGEKSWYSVNIPFVDSDSESEVFVNWSGLDEIKSTATVITQTSEAVSATKYVVEDHEVKAVTTESDSDLSTEDAPSLCPLPGEIPDAGCIASLAQAYAVEVASCGLCVGSSGWLTDKCVICAATLVEEDFDTACYPCQPV